MWTCPDCERRFGRPRQAHECFPAMTLDEYFSTGPPWERAVFDAVLDHLESLGPIHVEPVSVGIFLKSSGSFVELRPMTKWVRVSFPLSRRVHHPKMTRQPENAGNRIVHFVNLRKPEDLDEDVRSLLTESYLEFG